MNTILETQSLACDLTAIPASEREEHIVTAPQLIQTAQEVRELPDGYALRFLNEPGKFLALAKYIENERLCCPFFNFGLDLEPNGGALWLRLTGAEGVKELLKATLLDNPETKADLKKLIQTGGETHLDELVAQVSLPQLAGVLNNNSNE
ncbi:MAG: hypothetical protein ABI986_14655 [Chloroflexota bacterium]